MGAENPEFVVVYSDLCGRESGNARARSAATCADWPQSRSAPDCPKKNNTTEGHAWPPGRIVHISKRVVCAVPWGSGRGEAQIELVTFPIYCDAVPALRKQAERRSRGARSHGDLWGMNRFGCELALAKGGRSAACLPKRRGVSVALIDGVAAGRGRGCAKSPPRTDWMKSCLAASEKTQSI